MTNDLRPVGTILPRVERPAAMCACCLPPEARPKTSTVDGRLPLVFEASGAKTRYITGHDTRPRARPLFNVPKFKTSEVVDNRVRRGGASPGSRPKDGDA